MKNFILTILNLILFSYFTVAQSSNKKLYTLSDILDQSKIYSISSKIAYSTKENSFFLFNSFKAAMKPQLAVFGNLADFSRDYFGVRQPDGTLFYQSRIQNLSSLSLSFSQRIQSTGGNLSINSQLARFDDFERKDIQYNGIPININLNQPLFAFNSFKWDKKIEPLKYKEAEKSYVREVGNISLQSTKYYFNVIDAQEDYQLAKRNMENQLRIFDIENKRINLGTTTKNKILQIKLQLLKSEQNLAKAGLNIKSSIFNLRSYAGIKDTSSFSLVLPEKLPLVDISIEKAISEAKKNRAEFIGYMRRKIEAERDLDQAKKDRFKTNLVVGFGLNNSASNLPYVYRNPNTQQTFSLAIQLPILDWGRTTEKTKLAESNLRLINYTIEQEDIALVQEIRNIVESIKLIYDNIGVARQADLIAQESYELTNEQYRFGKVSITDLNIALEDKDSAKRAYITSLRSFWESYFLLKNLTLCDL